MPASPSRSWRATLFIDHTVLVHLLNSVFLSINIFAGSLTLGFSVEVEI
jgi:hypothetical protein